MKRLLRTIFTLVGVFFLWGPLFSFAGLRAEKPDPQRTIKIAGSVVDAETGEPLIGANVLVEGTAYGAATDRQGEFQIYSLPVGSYTVRAQMIGYAPAEKTDIHVQTDATVHIHFRLRPTLIQLGSLLVWGVREAPSDWESPSAVTILSQGTLRKSGAQDLGDFLRSQPGILVYDTGGKGGKRTVSIRGSHTNQVLILVDGVKVNPAQNNLVDLATIPLDWIDHIEIVKSGGATLFGNDAIGGVINIVTRKGNGEEPKFSLRVGQGSFGSRQAALFFSPMLKTFRMNLSLQERYARGNFLYKDLFGHTKMRCNNGLRDWNVFLNVSKSDFFGGRAYFSIQRYRAFRGVPGALRQLTPHASLKDNRWLVQSGWNLPFKKIAILKLTGFYQRYRQDYFSPRPWVFSPVNSLYINEALGVQSHAQIFANTKSPLFFGADARLDRLEGKDRIRPQLSLGCTQRQTWSAFLLWHGNFLLPHSLFFQKIIFSPGFRADFPTDFPDVASPSLGMAIVHKGDWRLTLKGTWGKTYRAPTFNDLFWVEDVFARGNPNLRPERGINRDVGAKIAKNLRGTWEAEVHFFDNSVQDMIYWRRSFDGKYMPVNVSRARLTGREETISAQLFNRHLKLSWNHTQLLATNHSGERTTEGKILPFRPKHEEKATVRFAWSGFESTISHRWVSKRFTREANTKVLLPYAVWNASLGGHLGLWAGKLRIRMVLENVTNTRYEILERYPMPGRSVEVQLEYEK